MSLRSSARVMSGARRITSIPPAGSRGLPTHDLVSGRDAIASVTRSRRSPVHREARPLGTAACRAHRRLARKLFHLRVSAHGFKGLSIEGLEQTSSAQRSAVSGGRDRRTHLPRRPMPAPRQLPRTSEPASPPDIVTAHGAILSAPSSRRVASARALPRRATESRTGRGQPRGKAAIFLSTSPAARRPWTRSSPRGSVPLWALARRPKRAAGCSRFSSSRKNFESGPAPSPRGSHAVGPPASGTARRAGQMSPAPLTPSVDCPARIGVVSGQGEFRPRGGGHGLNFRWVRRQSLALSFPLTPALSLFQGGEGRNSLLSPARGGSGEGENLTELRPASR